MATLFLMPELAANTTEAVLGAWLVTENTAFAAGEALVTVETDKASVDLEAEADGVLLRALVPAGTSVEVGTPIAVLGVVGESAESAESGGSGDSADGAVLDTAGSVGPAIPTSPADAESVRSPADNGVAPAAARIFTSPLARRLTTEAGLDLAVIVGTGPGGRIVRRDVTAAIAAGATPADGVPAPQPAPRSQTAPRSQPAVARSTAGDFTDIPHTRMRRAIAKRLTEAKQTIPHFYLRGTCRVDKLLALRAELNASGPARISVNDLILKAAARAHVLVPAANAIWTEAATRTFATADLAVAIATETGLVTPVLHAVDRTPVSILAAQVRDFATRARTGTLRPDELVGGTMTVTNLGMYGTEEFAAIINPPQSMILAVGAARPEPVAENGAIIVANLLRTTLSADHRVIDGALAAEWLKAFVEVVENPVRALM